MDLAPPPPPRCRLEEGVSSSREQDLDKKGRKNRAGRGGVGVEPILSLRVKGASCEGGYFLSGGNLVQAGWAEAGAPFSPSPVLQGGGELD